MGRGAAEMGRRALPASSTAVLLLVGGLIAAANGQPLVPAVIIFGDSAVDAGNNNGRLALMKADFPPYGRDFPGHRPTGRFCNGKLATDFTVETLGFNAYPPAYLGPNATGNNLLIGANFASGGSGYLLGTALLCGAIPLKKQLLHYEEYREEVSRLLAGNETQTDAIASGAIHLLSAGSSDFLQNYYVNPVHNLLLSAAQFADLLVDSFSCFVRDLYKLGARKIGVTSLPPLGCVPAAITLFGWEGNGCVKRLNDDSIVFNQKLHNAAANLTKSLTGLKLVVFDIYGPLLDLIDRPSENGFFEARKACCGTGIVETSFLCNAKSVGTCKNATGYVFWDSVHPSEAANQVLANALLGQAIDLLT